MTEQVKQYIGGEFAISDSKQWLDVTNPATNEVIAQVPCATESEMNAAIAAQQKHSSVGKKLQRRSVRD